MNCLRFVIGAALLFIVTTGQAIAQNSSRNNCTAALTSFITELDQLLASDPRSVRTVLALLDKYFPLKGCDVEEAIKICRQSKYIEHISEDARIYVILFNSSRTSAYLGFRVQFGLLRDSGNSSLPSAQVNQ